MKAIIEDDAIVLIPETKEEMFDIAGYLHEVNQGKIPCIIKIELKEKVIGDKDGNK